MASSTNETSRRWRVLLVEDHPVVRRGLASLMDEQHDMEICGEADNAQQALTAVRELQPDVVIADISLAGTDGIELTKEITARRADLPVLVLSVFDECLYAERALRAGASGYLMKSESAANLLQAVRRVLDGKIYLSDKSSARILAGLQGNRSSEDPHTIDQLSDRELQVFRCIGRGMNNTEIAESLCISVKTVEAHRENIKKKLNLKRASELVRYAIAHDLNA
jgi:DNA-binding NarL/FixJ family response regulator